MRSLSVALTAALLFAAPAQASEFHAWPSGYQGLAGYAPAIIEHDPWIDAASATPMLDDAYVFADVASGGGLSQDAIAAAVRFDVERLARPARASVAGFGRLLNISGRVAFAFDRFVRVGLGYASIDIASGRGGPASLAYQPALEPAVLAMTSLKR